jgi:hypothetical protein
MSESFKFMQIKVILFSNYENYIPLLILNNFNRFGAKMETQSKKHKLNGDVDVIDENKKKKNKK